MPIPLPNLDDRTYADLTAEARTLLPTLHPGWTNHNPSDPGIVLVELLAWLTEMLLFQVNEVPPANTEKFLKLLNGPGWSLPATASLDLAARQTVLDLRERYRAVTPDDYEWLTLHAWPRSDAATRLGAAATVRRVCCVPGRDLSASDPAVRRAPAPAHVSVVVVTDEGPGAELRAALWAFLRDRRVLTTRHHVVEPDYLPVELGANLALHGDAPPDLALDAARRALEAFYDPLTGGPERTGWPFGRPVHASEVYAVLDGVAVNGQRLVDYVEDVRVSTPAGADRLPTDPEGRVAAVLLDTHELVRIESTELVAYDVYGRPHRPRA